MKNSCCLFGLSRLWWKEKSLCFSVAWFSSGKRLQIRTLVEEKKLTVLPKKDFENQAMKRLRIFRPFWVFQRLDAKNKIDKVLFDLFFQKNEVAPWKLDMRARAIRKQKKDFDFRDLLVIHTRLCKFSTVRFQTEGMNMICNNIVFLSRKLLIEILTE